MTKTYTQSTCPTIRRIFLTEKECDDENMTIANLVMKNQIDGKATSRILASKIRAKDAGKKFTQGGILKSGAGLHEVIPTDLGQKIRAIDNESSRSAAAQTQSGLRPSTALILFRSCAVEFMEIDKALGISYIKVNSKYFDKIWAHTGTFCSGAGITGGQKTAHDLLRNCFTEAVYVRKLNGYALLLRMACMQLTLLPPGYDVLRDKNLDGCEPVLMAVKGKFEPAVDADDTKKSGASFGKNRTQFVQIYDPRREQMKARVRALKYDPSAAARSQSCSPSPERTPVKKNGKGGIPVKSGKQSALPPVPIFPGKYPIAHAAAWVSQPLRLTIPSETESGTK